jgi:hypothetical protein
MLGENPGIRHYPLGGDDVNPNLLIDSSIRKDCSTVLVTQAPHGLKPSLQNALERHG